MDIVQQVVYYFFLFFFYYVVRFLANNFLSHFLVVLTTLNDLE